MSLVARPEEELDKPGGVPVASSTLQGGEKDHFGNGICCLKGLGLTIEALCKCVSQDIDKTLHSGASTAFCPTNVLYFGRHSSTILFDPERYAGCQRRVSACPARIIEVSLF